MQNNINFTLGLLMGDGSFQINHWKKKYLQYRIVIKLKNTSLNLKMLQCLRKYFKLGTIIPGEKSVVWAINHKKQVYSFLKIITTSPLVSFKHSTNVKILKMLYGIENNISYDEYSFMEKTELNEGDRKWSWPFEKPNALINTPDFSEDYKHWLSGFVEAEGCFCIRKNGNQSFSISQKNDKLIIESIKSYFKIPNKILQKKCGTFVIETYNSKNCFLIVEFFERYPLRGEKNKSFERFKIHMESKYNKK